MTSDQELQDLVRYKQPRDRAHAIGELLRVQQQRLGAELLGEISAVIRDLTDDFFQEHCRAVQFRRGHLTIAVDDPGLVFGVRRQYLFLLKEAIAQTLPQAGVVDIQFRSEQALGI